MSERRVHPRFPHRAPIRFYLDGDPEADFVLDSADLSFDGLFVPSELLPDTGDRMAFELDWAGRPVCGWARVVRVDEEAAEPGFGVVFEAIAAQ